jgi:hypothetical protein
VTSDSVISDQQMKIHVEMFQKEKPLALFASREFSSVASKEGEVCDIVEVAIPTIHCTEDGREAFIQVFLA